MFMNLLENSKGYRRIYEVKKLKFTQKRYLKREKD